MAVHRSGPTPCFYEYICHYALVPSKILPDELRNYIAPGQQINWVEIPRFQRGISWDVENVKELLSSTSILLGNVILAQFDANLNNLSFLPKDTKNINLLIDGLQRFAVGTALISVVHELFLATGALLGKDKEKFLSLSTRVFSFSAFYLHNDQELRLHPRQAIKEQYFTLRHSLANYVKSEVDSGRVVNLANDICRLFVSRQVSLDIYFNFERKEILNTFIGINTVRVDLGPVDLLRANILEQATAANWSEAEIEEAENDFTEVFTLDQKPKQHYLPYVNAILKVIDDRLGARVLPSWGSLTRDDLTRFLEFIEFFENEVPKNSYLMEIFNCGKLPASIVIAYYYDKYINHTHLHNVHPNFFSEEVDNLKAFLICCYRLLLNNSVGRIGEDLYRIVNGDNGAASLIDISNEISTRHLGTNISLTLDPQWLETSLNSIDRGRAQRIFNAMLLPIKNGGDNQFKNIEFGRASRNFNVDHLIPHSMLDNSKPGSMEGQTLRNFAPLPTNQNRVAKATDCSSKLSSEGIYPTYIASSAHIIHPYVEWLVEQAKNLTPSSLNNQEKLERNSQPGIGDERIKFIRDNLLERI